MAGSTVDTGKSGTVENQSWVSIPSWRKKYKVNDQTLEME